jgi:hypothetical protein
MPKCYKCKVEKEIEEFHRDRTSSSGRSYDCKACKSALRKKKRAENPEFYREQCRKSTLKNYETIRASQKKHREENREKILARRRELREPRKAEINEREKIRRKNDPNFLPKNRERYKRYYEKNKHKMRPKHEAHKMVMFAVKLGFLKRSERCEECKIQAKTEGHHEDYKKPLEVLWLCKRCHRQKHLKYQKVKHEI